MNHMLEVLITLGANVNYQGATMDYSPNRLDYGLRIRNSTALHWAMRNKNKEAITLLLGAGANPNLRDSGLETGWGDPIKPRTPLEWARKRIDYDYEDYEDYEDPIIGILQNAKGK